MPAEGPGSGARRPALSPRRPALDGLRAVAVGSVVAYHFGGGAGSVLPGGFLGVDVFFVLSGYLITGLLVAEVRRTGTVDLAGFWARRVRRLLPAAALMIAVVGLYVWWAVPPQNWPARRADLLWTIGYAANWHFLAAGEDYFAAYAGASPLRHAWSLAIEEQFYLVWPCLVLLVAGGLRRVRARSGTAPRGRGPLVPPVVALTVVLLGAVAASAAAMALEFRSGSPSRAYYGTEGRVQELLVGALGALLLPRLRRPARVVTWAAAGGLAVLAAGFLTLGDSGPLYYRGGALVISAATLAVLAGAETVPASPVARLLSRRPAVALGRVSYGVYLWHWPVSVAWMPDPAASTAERAGVQVGRCALTVLLAACSYRWLEQPVLAGRVPWVRASRRRLAVVAVVVVALLAEGAVAATALPGGLASQLADGADRPCPGETVTRLPVCVRGPTTSAPQVLLLGDSTARALAPGLDVATAAEGRGWVQAAWHRCTPTGLLVLPNGMTEPDAPARACVAQARSQIAAALARYRPRLVLVAEYWSHHQSLVVAGRLLRPGTPEHAAALRAAYAGLAAEIARSGAQTVFVELSPPGESLGPDVAAGRPAGARSTAPGGEYVEAFNQVLRSVAAADPDRVATISVDDLLCPGGRCAAVQGGELVRADGVHLTARFSRQLGPELLRRASAAAARR